MKVGQVNIFGSWKCEFKGQAIADSSLRLKAREAALNVRKWAFIAKCFNINQFLCPSGH